MKTMRGDAAPGRPWLFSLQKAGKLIFHLIGPVLGFNQIIPCVVFIVFGTSLKESEFYFQTIREILEIITMSFVFSRVKSTSTSDRGFPS